MRRVLPEGLQPLDRIWHRGQLWRVDRVLGRGASCVVVASLSRPEASRHEALECARLVDVVDPGDDRWETWEGWDGQRDDSDEEE